MRRSGGAAMRVLGVVGEWGGVGLMYSAAMGVPGCGQ